MELFSKVINCFQLLTIFGSVIKRQTSQTTSDYKWLWVRLQVITSDYEWLQVTTSVYNQLQVTTAKNEYEWQRVTANDY